jgi:hypothetical protein
MRKEWSRRDFQEVWDTYPLFTPEQIKDIRGIAAKLSGSLSSLR